MIKKISCLLIVAISLSGCASIKFSEKTVKYKPEIPVYKNIKVALVLGAGGAKGLAHVGVIEELLANGIKPDLIVGCSAGAIVGAMYADNLDIHAVKMALISGTRRQFLDRSLASLPISIYGGKKMVQFLTRNIRAKNIEQLKIPFAAVSTNLNFGDITIFAKGEVVPAVMASSAYPGAFYPVKIKGQYFVDGGVFDPIPVNIARQMGAKIIIAVDIGGLLTKSSPKHMLGLIKRSLEISYINQSIMASKDADILINVPFDDVDTFTDSLNNFIYQQGKAAARSKMFEIKELLLKIK